MKTPLQKAREKRGWTQAFVADTLDIDRGHYCRIEDGANTSPTTAKAIAELFGREVTEMELLYRPKKRKRNPRRVPERAA